MTRRQGALLSTILMLSAVACGGGPSTKTETVPTSTQGSTRAPGSSSSLPNASTADADKAQNLVLRSADFPPGWISAPHKPSASGEETGKQLAACVGRPDPSTYETADVHSPDFQMGAGASALSVQSDASFVKSRQDAQADYAAFQDPRLATCFKDIFEKSLHDEGGSQGTSVNSVAFDPQPVAHSYGDGTLRYRVTAMLQGPNGAGTIYFEFVLMTKDRTEIDATFETLGQPFPSDLEDTLVNALGTRLDAA